MADIWIDDDTLARLRARAEQRDCDIDDLVREFAASLDVNSDDIGPDSWPTTLSPTTRESLALAHDAFGWMYASFSSEVDPDEKWALEEQFDHHTAISEVLRKGWTGEYRRVFAELRPELSAHDCDFVREVLKMFSAIQTATEYLTETEREQLGEDALALLRFRGFGGGREQPLGDYACALVLGSLDAYTRFDYPNVVDKDVLSHFPWNGDHYTGHSYARMTRVMAAFAKKAPEGALRLTVDVLAAAAEAARPHPDDDMDR